MQDDRKRPGKDRIPRAHSLESTEGHTKAKPTFTRLKAKNEMEAMQEEAFLLALDIVTSQPVVVKEDELPSLVNAAYERRFAELDKWLNRRLAAIKTYWKGRLLIPSHRPPSKNAEYEEAAKLRQEKQYSWAKLGLAIDPEAFKRDPHRTADRIRKGVKGLGRKDPGKKRDNRLFMIPLFFRPRELSNPALEPTDPDWARKKLEEAGYWFLDVAERHGYTTDELLNEIIMLYLLIADRAEPGKGATRLLREAKNRYLGERISGWTPAEVEQIFGQPLTRQVDGETLLYDYGDMTVEFQNGKFFHIRPARENGSASKQGRVRFDSPRGKPGKKPASLSPKE